MILQQPDTVSLSGNIKDLIFSSTEEKEVVIQLNNVTVYSGRYTPDNSGNITVKLSDIIPTLLTVPAPNSDDVSVTDISRIVFVASGDNSGEFYCVKGGVSGSVSADTFLRANFLTWQPQILKTFVNAPIFIRYASLGNYLLKVKAYFHDGSNETKTIYNCIENKIYTFNVSFQVIAGKFGRTPSYFDIWVSDSTGEKVSFIQRYALSNYGANDDLFLFENTLGGIDTICFSGVKKEETEVETLSSMQGDDLSIDYDIDFSRAYTKNIGYFPIKILRGWVSEFFRSTQRYHVTEKGIEPIVVSNSNIASEKYVPSSYSFTFAYSKKENYLNFPRLESPPEVVDIIDPDHTVFSLAPRLYEFPLADVGADPLIPVQHPFTDTWRYLPISAITRLENEGGGGSDIDIIKTGDTTPPTENNVFSALRSLGQFHPKGGNESLDFVSKNNTISGDLKVGNNTQIGGNVSVGGTTTTLNAIVQRLATIYDLDVTHVATLFNTVIKNQLSSENFISGFTGEGMKLWKAINGDWNLEIDNLTVRKAFYVFELILQKIRSINGALAITQGNGTIKSVSETTVDPAYYVCEIEGDMTFEAGDFVRCQVFSASRLKYYWVKVYQVTGNSIYLLKSDFSTDIPEAGDEIVQIGNDTNPNRQSVLYLSASEDGKPRFSVLDGVNSPSFVGKTKAVLGYIGDIIDSSFPAEHQPSGYGLYCQNAFLSGIFVLSNGKSVEDEIGNINTQIIAIPGLISSSVTEEVSKINVGAQNLLVYGDFEQGDISGNGEISSNPTYNAFTARTKDFIAISGTNLIKNEFGGTHNIGLFFYDANKTFISNNFDFNYPVSIAIPPNARYMKAWVRKSSDTAGSSRPYQEIIRDAKVMVSYGTNPVPWSISPEDIASGYYTQIGGRNLLPDSKDVSDTPTSFAVGYLAAYRNLTRTLNAGDTVIFSYSGVTSNSIVGFALYSLNSDIDVFPANTPVTLTKSYTYFRVRVSTSASFAADYMKLEVGTKATDWSPAPEDVQDELDDKVATTVYNTGITQLSNQISLKASQTDLNALGNRVSATESEILLMPDKISLAVTNIKIGGKNLLKYSTLDKRTGWAFTYGTSLTTFNGVSCFKTVYDSRQTYWGCYSSAGLYEVLSEGEEYTASIDVYATGSISIAIGFEGSGKYVSVPTQNKWVRISLTAKTPSARKTIVFYPQFSTGSSTIVYYKNYQIERGNKASDWAPAPEEVPEALQRTGIDIEAGTITLDAAKTVITGSLIVKGIQNGGINVGGNCIITSTGLITAKGATIEGNITATSGSIGGVSISNNRIGIDSSSTSAVGSFLAAGYLGVRSKANYFRVDANDTELQCTINKQSDTTPCIDIKNTSTSGGSTAAMAMRTFGKNELYGGIQILSASATIIEDNAPKLEITKTDFGVTLRVNNTGEYVSGYLRITSTPATGGNATVEFVRD